MTRETFINTLKGYGYSYEMAGDRIIVTNYGNVNLEISSIPSGVEFRGSGNVDLSLLETIPSDIIFNNGGNVYLNSLKSIPPGVIFNNKLSLNLESLIIGNRYDIKGIRGMRLLNLMISRGMLI